VNEDQVRDLLKRACEEAGSQKAFADKHGLSGAYISDVLQGRRDLGKSILDALGIVAVTTYRRIRK